MDRVIEFTYPPHFAGKVARDYVRQCFWPTVIPLVFIFCALAAFIPRSGWLDAPILGLSLALMFTAIVLHGHYSRTVQRWDGYLGRMRTLQATLRLTDDALTIASDNGSHTIPWRTIRQVSRERNLCLFASSDYEAICLPGTAIDDEAWAFIETRVKEFGGSCKSRRTPS